MEIISTGAYGASSGNVAQSPWHVTVAEQNDEDTNAGLLTGKFFLQKSRATVQAILNDIQATAERLSAPCQVGDVEALLHAKETISVIETTQQEKMKAFGDARKLLMYLGNVQGVDVKADLRKLEAGETLWGKLSSRHPKKPRRSNQPKKLPVSSSQLSWTSIRNKHTNTRSSFEKKMLSGDLKYLLTKRNRVYRMPANCNKKSVPSTKSGVVWQKSLTWWSKLPP